jgi:carboxymethylenebutenolidase
MAKFIGESFSTAQKFAVGGVTATALFEMLRPNYAWAIQVPETDNRIKVEPATVPSPKGNGTINGYVVHPANATGKLPAVLVVHENRGLNPYIKDVARRLAIANFLALAPDGLTSVGGYPGDDERGAKLFTEVDRAKMTEDFLAAATWLKSRPECTGKLGAASAFASVEALSTFWPCGWGLTLMLQFHSTEISPAPPMWPRSNRRYLHTTVN